MKVNQIIPPNRNLKNLKSAFTLVEILLGLAIGAIISVSVYNMFWSAMKLDDKMHRVYDNYIEVLMADQALTHDLENAIMLDYSASYPDAKIFDGKKDEFSFLTQTQSGIKRVRYYSGLYNSGAARSLIGRVVNSSDQRDSYSNGELPIEFLLRQQSTLSDWLNETTNDTSVQIVAAGIKKGSFGCKYAPMGKDLHMLGAKAMDYKDSWDSKDLPLAVSCSFELFDPKNAHQGLIFKRDVFLAPVANYHNEQ